MNAGKRLGILVGGGPAPGINTVISSAAIEAINEGFEVVGIQDGFKNLVRRNPDKLRPLAIDDVSRVHLDGGSVLGTSRENPTKSPEALQAVIETLQQAGITHLVTIGGDDTALSSRTVSERSQGTIKSVHVPKTIDNDLPLPPHVPTFGFQTARHVGVELVRNLMEDAKATRRWYVVVAMGRKAGHLALGIGKAAGATLTMIPEEFSGKTVRLKAMVDTLAGAIIKRLSYGRRDGVAIIAEGLVLDIDPADLAALEDVERDAHGHVRIAEVNIGEILKAEVTKRLKSFGIKATLVAKNIGYELRCADPVPFDMEYTRDLGYCATKYLLSGGNAAMVSLQGGHFVPVPFAEMLDPKTGKARLRLVDVRSTRYAIARRYMIRLRRDDFEDPHELAKFAATCGLHLGDFRNEFEYLIKNEPPKLDLEADAAAARAEDGAHQH